MEMETIPVYIRKECYAKINELEQIISMKDEEIASLNRYISQPQPEWDSWVGTFGCGF